MKGYIQLEVIGSANCMSSRMKICKRGRGVGAFDTFRSGDARRAVSSSGCWKESSCTQCIPGWQRREDYGERGRRRYFAPLAPRLYHLACA